MNGFWYRIRFPLIAMGMFCLVLGVWSGLVRAGWDIYAVSDLAAMHGPLMVCGFIGTVIGLERAVALSAPWGYAAPFASAVGTLAALAGAGRAGAGLVIVSSAVLSAVYVAVLKKQFTLFNVVMGVGALAWLAGNLMWAAGYPLSGVVPWWGLFLTLTIAGERLELSRFLNYPLSVRGIFIAVGILMVVGAVSATAGLGSSILGMGMMFMALWLAQFDVARRTVFQEGLTRFVAACLLSGYFWLMVAGSIVMHQRELAPGFEYDAALHALFLGFVFSMIFGHAPIIFPAVLRVAVPYRPAFYGHLALLNLSLAVRVLGDIASNDRMGEIGAMLNAAALALFLANTVNSVRLGLSAK